MILGKLVKMQNLTAQESEGMGEEMLEGKYTDAQVGAILTALKMKGETQEEIVGIARAMKRKAIIINPKAGKLVDSCGTGGDSSNTFNISTAAALVASGAGVSIAKHGNRSVSSNCGSADVLEELGVKMLEPERARECIEKIKFG
ncbi:anthranilate phosphoribosyltransferase, partial [Candidatus Micrarchaeota archaeon]|nr:anthranilate phosphoribosyltransferase [Candidatus Micrarchaeota archaeon]